MELFILLLLKWIAGVLPGNVRMMQPAPEPAVTRAARETARHGMPCVIISCLGWVTAFLLSDRQVAMLARNNPRGQNGRPHGGAPSGVPEGKSSIRA